MQVLSEESGLGRVHDSSFNLFHHDDSTDKGEVHLGSIKVAINLGKINVGHLPDFGFQSLRAHR